MENITSKVLKPRNTREKITPQDNNKYTKLQTMATHPPIAIIIFRKNPNLNQAARYLSDS
jgi:hypothetical protein